MFFQSKVDPGIANGNNMAYLSFGYPGTEPCLERGMEVSGGLAHTPYGRFLRYLATVLPKHG